MGEWILLIFSRFGRVLTAVVVVTCLGDCTPGIWAQQTVPRDSMSADTTTAARGNTLVPLPVFFYMPETGVGFGAIVGYYFRLSGPAQPDTAGRNLPSYVFPILIYTSKKQIITQLRTELYPARGRYRLTGLLGYSKFPTKFWGIGNDTPEEDSTKYTAGTFDNMLEFQRQLAVGWYLGVIGQAAHRKLLEVEPGSGLDTGTIPGAEDGTIVGVGLSVARDTRTNTTFPRSGSFHQIRATLFDGLFGSDYEYGTLSLDFRKYLSPRQGHVLALRVYGVGTTGSPPFERLAMLGGDLLLRGYYIGRFRDKDMLALQAEYRATLWWRIGAVAFVGAGQVASRLADFEPDGFKASAGLGLRILLSPREGLNIRADYGRGFDVGSSGFYLSLGEVF